MNTRAFVGLMVAMVITGLAHDVVVIKKVRNGDTFAERFRTAIREAEEEIKELGCKQIQVSAYSNTNDPHEVLIEVSCAGEKKGG